MQEGKIVLEKLKSEIMMKMPAKKYNHEYDVFLHEYFLDVYFTKYCITAHIMNVSIQTKCSRIDIYLLLLMVDSFMWVF